MTKPAHITQPATEAFKTMSRILRNLPDAITLITREAELHDGYPTKHPLASPNSTPRPQPLTGTCTTPIQIDYADRPGHFTDQCGDPRPCRWHDTPITLTSVEAAASRLTQQTDTLTTWKRKAEKIDQLCADLEHNIMRALPKKEPTLCNGGQGREGHMEGPTGWGTTNCGAHVDHEGMCNNHIEDERKWRAANGKPPRIIEHTYLHQHRVTKDQRGRFTAA